MSSRALLGQEGEGVLVLWGDIDPTKTDEADLNDWWTNEHLPERLQLPGFVRAHRYRAFNPASGNNEYLACYEVSKVQDLASPEYMSALNNPTARTKKFMPCLAGMNRSGCSVLDSRQSDSTSTWPPNNAVAYLLLFVFYPQGQELRHSLNNFNFGSYKSVDTTKRCTSILIARQDDGVTTAGSSSRSYDGVKFAEPKDTGQKYILLLTLTIDPLATLRSPSEEAQATLTSFAEDMKHMGLSITYEKAFEFICTIDESMLKG